MFQSQGYKKYFIFNWDIKVKTLIDASGLIILVLSVEGNASNVCVTWVNSFEDTVLNSAQCHYIIPSCDGKRSDLVFFLYLRLS